LWSGKLLASKPKQLSRGDDPEPLLTPEERLAALLAAQGVQPVRDIAELAFPDWPEDESADDLIAAVRAWREGRDTPRRP
jgi:hypothetical protein